MKERERLARGEEEKGTISDRERDVKGGTVQDAWTKLGGAPTERHPTPPKPTLKDRPRPVAYESGKEEREVCDDSLRSSSVRLLLTVVFTSARWDHIIIVDRR